MSMCVLLGDVPNRTKVTGCHLDPLGECNIYKISLIGQEIKKLHFFGEPNCFPGWLSDGQDK